jgi:hypothetical protein
MKENKEKKESIAHFRDYPTCELVIIVVSLSGCAMEGGGYVLKKSHFHFYAVTRVASSH